jgi:two-component system response regulator AtoC
MRTSTYIPNLMVVSRDLGVLRSIATIKASNRWRFDTASNAWEAMEQVRAGASPQLLLLDLFEGDADCLDMLRWMRRIRPALPVILIGPADDMNRQDESTRLGARAYLTRPLDERLLATTIESSLSPEADAGENVKSSEDAEALGDDSYFVSISPQMRRVRAQAALLAGANVPVLILGEAGTGKETIARLMHKLSVRSGFNFAKVSCAALSQDQLERELFGYETAGTTAPATIKPGKIDLCARGTILLEDITEMSDSVQSSVLNIIRSKRFIRPGASGFTEADVRIFACRPFNGGRRASDNGFRSDLLQHLRAHTIQIPPLRDQKDGIAQLAQHFIRRLARQYGLPPRELSPVIIQEWREYEWPGNLSEMEHLVKRYLMVGDEALLRGLKRTTFEAPGSKGSQARVAGNDSSGLSPSLPDPTEAGGKSLRTMLKSLRTEAEKDAIARALEKTGGNRKAAARLLKVSYRTVLYKIEEYKMTPPGSSQLPRANVSRDLASGVRVDTGSAHPGVEALVDRRRELP